MGGQSIEPTDLWQTERGRLLREVPLVRSLVVRRLQLLSIIVAVVALGVALVALMSQPPDEAGDPKIASLEDQVRTQRDELDELRRQLDAAVDRESDDGLLEAVIIIGQGLDRIDACLDDLAQGIFLSDSAEDWFENALTPVGSSWRC